MKRLLFVLACILALAIPGNAQNPFPYRIDFADYQPSAPLYVGQMYCNTYNQCVYVTDLVTLRDRTRMLLLQNISGKWCNTANNICLVSPMWPRGVYLFPAYYR